MRGLLFLTLTAVTVSLDSFLCGFSLATKRRGLTGRTRLAITLIASLTVGALCTAGALLGARLGTLLARRAQTVGGFVLAIMGTAQLLSIKKKRSVTPNRKRRSAKFNKIQRSVTSFPQKKENCAIPFSQKKEGEDDPSQKHTPRCAFFALFEEAALIGVGIGSDGAMASVTLAATGYPPLLPALAVTLCHVALIGLGLRLAACKKIKGLKIIPIIAPLLLITLGAWKMLMP